MDMHEIYMRYRDIVSRNGFARTKEELASLSELIESRGLMRNRAFDSLSKLMASLNLTADLHAFTCFYDFVFFICRENGQKGIAIYKAVAAWKIVLQGRFRLLNQWCEFVEKYQRHNISEDTWQQVLLFSRCVREDLEGYDPRGSWPVLIDDFVEHMYRVTESKCCCCNISVNSCNSDASSTLPGIRVLPGSKRKLSMDLDSDNSQKMKISKFKQRRLDSFADTCDDEPSSSATDFVDGCMEVNMHNLLGCSNNSTCAVEDSLLKGIEGLSTGHSFAFDQGRRASYI